MLISGLGYGDFDHSVCLVRIGKKVSSGKGVFSEISIIQRSYRAPGMWKTKENSTIF